MHRKELCGLSQGKTLVEPWCGHVGWHKTHTSTYINGLASTQLLIRGLAVHCSVVFTSYFYLFLITNQLVFQCLGCKVK